MEFQMNVDEVNMDEAFEEIKRMETPLTDEQFEAGLSEARRIINQSAGYYFGGELVPFAKEFKSLALRAINDKADHDSVGRKSSEVSVADSARHSTELPSPGSASEITEAIRDAMREFQDASVTLDYNRY